MKKLLATSLVLFSLNSIAEESLKSFVVYVGDVSEEADKKAMRELGKRASEACLAKTKSTHFHAQLKDKPKYEKFKDKFFGVSNIRVVSGDFVCTEGW